MNYGLTPQMTAQIAQVKQGATSPHAEAQYSLGPDRGNAPQPQSYGLGPQQGPSMGPTQPMQQQNRYVPQGNPYAMQAGAYGSMMHQPNIQRPGGYSETQGYGRQIPGMPAGQSMSAGPILMKDASNDHPASGGAHIPVPKKQSPNMAFSGVALRPNLAGIGPGQSQPRQNYDFSGQG